MMDIYDFHVKARDGREVSLAEYKGKVLLMSGVAARFEPTESMDAVKERIETLL